MLAVRNRLACPQPSKDVPPAPAPAPAFVPSGAPPLLEYARDPPAIALITFRQPLGVAFSLFLLSSSSSPPRPRPEVAPPSLRRSSQIKALLPEPLHVERLPRQTSTNPIRRPSGARHDDL